MASDLSSFARIAAIKEAFREKQHEEWLRRQRDPGRHCPIHTDMDGLRKQIKEAEKNPWDPSKYTGHP